MKQLPPTIAINIALSSFSAFSVLTTLTSGDVAISATLTVPGTSNPYLAGLPNGSIATAGNPVPNAVDVAPTQSPVQVTGVSIAAGNILNFSTTGSVSFVPSPSGDSPDGSFNVNHIVENGIAGYDAPANSLVGVFLDSSLPTDSVAPVALDFNTPASKAYTTLSPLLKQVFFIGDGLTLRLRLFC